MKNLFKFVIVLSSLFTAFSAKGELPFSLSGNVDLPSSYVFRGYNIHDTGMQLQPSFNLFKSFNVNDSFTLTPHLNNWNNTTSENFGTSDDFSNWDESRVSVGAKVESGVFTLDTAYTYYAYPNDRQGDNSELSSTVGYNGNLTSLFGTTLNPHFTVAYQVSNEDTDENVYFELGVEPKHLCNVLGENVLFSLPITYGGSMDNYFTDSTGKNEVTGFISTGLHAKYQFTEHFDIHGGVDYYYLVADSAQEANGSNNLITGFVGLGWSF